MTLGDVAIGEAVTVTYVGGDRAFRRRLMELGVLPGTRIEVIRVAPLGDPIELTARGCFLSIRRQEAQLVDVTQDRARVAATSAASIAMHPGLPASP
jgi:ferrous iron transport protein A